MAGIVNLQQSEYDTALEKIESIHQATLEGIEKISSRIRELSEIEGGFYIEKISEKISALLNTLDTGVCAPMADNMDNTKVSMESFAEIIVNTDSACDV